MKKFILAAVAALAVSMPASSAVYEVSRGNLGVKIYNDSSRIAFCKAYYYGTGVTWDFTIPAYTDYNLYYKTSGGVLSGWRCRY
mgnify:CR=1 FL=1